MVGGRNVFSIGRIRHNENQLTEMLAWLAAAVPDVAAKIVGLALPSDLPQLDAADVEISTQYSIPRGFLDLLFESQSLVLVVESKLWSGYDSDQLRKYLDWLHGRRDGRVCGLMTLTEFDAPWPQEDEEFADKEAIQRAARRWRDLYVELGPLTEGAETGDLQATLVGEFLEMLQEEGLIPMTPLSPTELGPAWSESREMINHFRAFLDACTGEIEAAVGAPAGARSYPHPEFVWRDFSRDDGWRLAVCFHYTDEGKRLKGQPATRTPILRLGARTHGDWPNPALLAGLEAEPPSGWKVDPEHWLGRATIWRHLAEVLEEGAFEEQRERLASACSDGIRWINNILRQLPN